MDFNDPTFTSRSALIISLVALFFSGISLWWEIHQGRKDRGILRAYAKLARMSQDEFGGHTIVEQERLFEDDQNWTAAFLLVKATNIGRRPVSFEGVYGRRKFPSYKLVRLGGNASKIVLNEAEEDTIYLDFNTELYSFSGLIIKDKSGAAWPVDKPSFREALRIAKELNLS